MFTPENLYFTLRENYGHDGAVFWIPKTNGEKYIGSFCPFIPNNHEYFLKSAIERSKDKEIWLYDQEPLQSYAVDIYKRHLKDGAETSQHAVIDQTPFSALAACFSRKSVFPIWCHSEFNSAEIKSMADMLYVPCFYWHHALVSKEWFRSYRYLASLAVKNKSRSQFRFVLYARGKTGTRQYRQTVIENLICFRDKILFDWDQKLSIGPEFSAKIDTDDAQNSAIHLVAETLFDTDKIYLTEKVLKPMIMSQPFIVWGPPGTLDYLRRYGFQTFDHVWSEQYDLERDHDKRMALLLDLIKRLSSLSDLEFYELYQKCLPIIDHNKRWFYDSRFTDMCWNELNSNFLAAFQRTDYLAKEYPGGQIFYVIDQHPDLYNLTVYRSFIHNYLAAVDYDQKSLIQKKYLRFNDL